MQQHAMLSHERRGHLPPKYLAESAASQKAVPCLTKPGFATSGHFEAMEGLVLDVP